MTTRHWKFLGGPDMLGNMAESKGRSDEDSRRLALGRAVEESRATRGLSKEAAARAVTISSITWKRVEDGLPVRDVKYGAVEKVLDWPRGSVLRYLREGGELPTSIEAHIDELRRNPILSQREVDQMIATLLRLRDSLPPDDPQQRKETTG